MSEKSALELQWDKFAEETRNIENGRVRLETEKERFEAELKSLMADFEKEFGTTDLAEIDQILSEREANIAKVMEAWKQKIEAAKVSGRECHQKLNELK